MADATGVRYYGRVFDEIAGEYDRHRPTYPDALIDRACAVAGLAPGTSVLEIGCGTGQLTRSLLARGLRVTAVEPGERLIRRARIRLDGAGDVQFLNRRLEDAPVPSGRYRAAFSASAIHWVDPDLGWRKLADALVDGGTLALVSYFGLEDSSSAADQQAFRAALARIAPELAAEWPIGRDLDRVLAGAAQRQNNVSEAWAWLGGYEIARGYAADLFEDAQLATVPTLVEHTDDELNALISTMSFWARRSPPQRDAVRAENEAVHRRLGRPIRSSTVACLLTARRTRRR
ncbi:MAG: methyltransferase domain-containing protein [Solirubrobacterales bacterium]|nr:methyltransferase domain-containing protein [Solirubrobacterales bacterium]